MTDVYVLVRDTLEVLGLVDQSFTKLEYTRRYQAMDTLSMVINRKRLYADQIENDRLLYMPAEGNRVFLVEQVESVQSGDLAKDLMTITGRSIEGIAMAERRILPPAGLSHDALAAVPAETAIKHYVEVSAVAAVDPDRNIPGLVIAPDAATGAVLDTSARYQQVLAFVADVGRLSGLGWEIILDREAGEFVFDILTGVDRTASVFFDFDFETLSEWEEIDSALESASVAIVAGQGEGIERDVVTRGTASGWDRREIFIDARDVELGDTGLLETRGDAALAANERVVSLRATVHQFGSFRYREHWDLGDIVTVRDTTRGLAYAARIIEVSVEFDETVAAPTVVATLGRSFPTLASRSAGGSSGGSGTVDYPDTTNPGFDSILLDRANKDVRLRRGVGANLVVDANGAALVTWLQVQATAGQRSVLSLGVAGEAQERTALWGDATGQSLEFGGGSGVRDVQLFRGGPGYLRLKALTASQVAFDMEAPAGQANIFGMLLTGDTHYRVQILGFGANPALHFGPGNVDADVILRRTGVLALETQSRFTAERTSGAGASFQARVLGDSDEARFVIRADGKIEWGSGSSLHTNLYSVGAAVLKTDGEFRANTLLVSNDTYLNAVYIGSNVAFDTYLSRMAGGHVKINFIGGGAVGGGGPSLIVAGSPTGDEGGEVKLEPGGSWGYTYHLDNYQDTFRIHDGTQVALWIQNAKIGFLNTAPVAKQTVVGARGGNAALASLLDAMSDYGLITDSTTA